MALSKNGINGDIARWLQDAGKSDSRFSGSRLRLYLEELGHSPDDIRAAFSEWIPAYLTRVSDDDFVVFGLAGWRAIENLLVP